ncbi:sigma factor-like helix-turn-helix DNA-binding protein [Microbispora sp. H10830]|uniref:sigma factor-like helix-turn-helix DNA-binding protein n=1 Tax=Microbispora sp. H10830 TaxID=2729109 RepID=UPI002175A64A|nr:sigma factor-like helix-turn-helix DNA-binding protein [Microbispora sp. H10830]
MALMLVLETLSPTERAVFVLREAFDVGYDEIAAAVGKSPAAVRQIAYRARRHVDARRPREAVSSGETRAALEAFRRALEAGDLQGLLDVLAPEVVLVSDGGGVKQAAPRIRDPAHPAVNAGGRTAMADLWRGPGRLPPTRGATRAAAVRDRAGGADQVAARRSRSSSRACRNGARRKAR